MAYIDPREHLSGFFRQAVNIDGKDVVDASSRLSTEELAIRYDAQREHPEFDSKAFFEQHFIYPQSAAETATAHPEHDIDQHIDAMWPVLTRHTRERPDGDQSLLELPHPYVVPGERFRETYYWDSYFTARGLAAAGKWDLVEGIVNNCAHQINEFGYVPNGNREYYLGRSHPPVFSYMVELLADRFKNEEDPSGKRGEVLAKYLPEMVQEYEFWMVGSDEVARDHDLSDIGRVVEMPDGTILNRYYDEHDTPRPESYRQDIETAHRAGLNPAPDRHEIFRHIRAAAESGFDFSGRWFADGKNIETIQTTNIIPVDLNCLLYDLEKTIADACDATGNAESAGHYKDLADKRAKAINTYLWDDEQGFYFDYNFTEEAHTNYPTMAAVFPLYSGIATVEQASGVARKLETDFLRPGGFATSLQETAEQWDGDNGWAPIHQIAVAGLERCSMHELANEARKRWLERTREVFETHRQLPEKIRVGKVAIYGCGGEYPTQTGFGWTNAAYIDLSKPSQHLESH